MAWTMCETLGSVRRVFPFDVVLCAWVYPDGCAVAELAARCDFPFVVIAQGSDVHQYLKMPARRKIIPPALNRARGVITRSGELARLLAEAGVSPEKLHTIYNGVDFDRFHPADRREARAELGLPPDAPVLLYVGNLLVIKNPLLLVAAHAELNRRRPQNPLHLVMLGDGLLRRDVERALRDSGTAHLARLPGRQPPERVARYMQAADLLCVPSDNEGVPNVILEAFACGLPVVSTNVGGIGEVLREGFLGRLVAPRDLPALVAALGDMLASPVVQEKIAAHASQFSWGQTASEYLKVLSP
jgi:glycosyltransferase involved in cell wall biosynthesis